MGSRDFSMYLQTPSVSSHPMSLIVNKILFFFFSFCSFALESRLPTSPPRSYLTPSPVAGAGRKHLPDGTPKPQTKRKRMKQIQTPRVSVCSNGSVEEGETGALVGNVTNDIRRVAKSPSYPEGGQSTTTKYVDRPQWWVGSNTALRKHFGKSL